MISENCCCRTITGRMNFPLPDKKGQTRYKGTNKEYITLQNKLCWILQIITHTHTHTETHRYVHSKTVLRNVETKLKVMTSPAGVRSGTSGRHEATQQCISAALNEPSSRSLLRGLHRHMPNSTSHCHLKLRFQYDCWQGSKFLVMGRYINEKITAQRLHSAIM